jgi:translation initiation factor 1
MSSFKEFNYETNAPSLKDFDVKENISVVKNKYHIRVQQRNGRKCITTLDGLEEDLDLKRICKAMRNSFSCNGNVVMKDDDSGTGVIQLQGDQRENIKQWLLDNEVILKNEVDRIVIHGF